jgi:hypothetical protein
MRRRECLNASNGRVDGAALPTSNYELAQQQPQAKSNDQSRTNQCQDISPVKRLNAGITQGPQEPGTPEHKHHHQTDKETDALTSLPFGLLGIFRLF